MNPRILVTGGTGFIGAWVVRELLQRGLETIVLDVRPPGERWQRILGDHASRVTFEAGSLLDPPRLGQIFTDQRITHVIHLAAWLTPACQHDPWTGCQVNVLGSIAIFEQARAHHHNLRGLAYASSLGIFGPEADDAPTPDAPDKNQPPTFYGVFKKAVEMIAEQYWRHYQVRSLSIRPHVVYGPERTDGLTAGPSLAARAVAQGEPFTINYTGAAGYDYVEDVAHAFVRAALETPPGANVVDLPSEAASVERIVEILDAICPGAAASLRVQGPPIPSNLPRRLNLISTLFPDWGGTTLAEGLRKTVEFYR